MQQRDGWEWTPAPTTRGPRRPCSKAWCFAAGVIRRWTAAWKTTRPPVHRDGGLARQPPSSSPGKLLRRQCCFDGTLALGCHLPARPRLRAGGRLLPHGFSRIRRRHRTSTLAGAVSAAVARAAGADPQRPQPMVSPQRRPLPFKRGRQPCICLGMLAGQPSTMNFFTASAAATGIAANLVAVVSIRSGVSATDRRALRSLAGGFVCRLAEPDLPGPRCHRQTRSPIEGAL